MTVAVALVCTDGVIAASDSMSSGGPQFMIAAIVPKVYAMTNVPVIWTGSGHVYVMEEVEKEMRELDQLLGEPGSQVAREAFLQPDLESIKTTISQHVKKKMAECYVSALPRGIEQTDPNLGNMHPFLTGFIFLGFANGTPWLLEIAADGALEWHTAQRFYAIGSGGDAATAAEVVLRHYVGDDLTVELGLGFAFRLIQSTCEVSAGGVRPPVQLAVVKADGAKMVTTLGEEDQEMVNFVKQWKESEADTLRQFAAQPPEEEPPKFEETPAAPAS